MLVPWQSVIFVSEAVSLYGQGWRLARSEYSASLWDCLLTPRQTGLELTQVKDLCE